MRLALGDVMDIVQLAMILVPLLGAAAGYLIEGVTGATSGFVIPIGPLDRASCGGVARRGPLMMRYDRYGRNDRPSPSPRARRQGSVRLQRRRVAMRPLRRILASVARASR